MVFKRVSTIDAKYNVFTDDKVTWRDVISTGYETNSYFFSAMAAMTLYPETLDEIFLNEKNTKGIYALKFHIRGKPWIVTIDDTLLVKYESTSYFKPVFETIHYQTHAVWSHFLFKGWAKVHGNYDSAKTGNGGTALTSLLGVPVVRHATSVGDKYEVLSSASMMWAQMKLDNDKGYVMTAKTGATSGTTYGLLNDHYYTVLSVFLLEDYATVKTNHSMVLLRDPLHERTQWSGSFSFLSNHKNAAARKYIRDEKIPFSHVNYNNTVHGVSQDYGVLYATSTEFFAAFEEVYVAHSRLKEDYRIDWVDYNYTSQRQTEIYKVVVPAVSGDIYFNVHQYPSGLFPKECRDSVLSNRYAETNLTVVFSSAVATVVPTATVAFKVLAAQTNVWFPIENILLGHNCPSVKTSVRN